MGIALCAASTTACTEPNPCFAPPLAASCPGADASSTGSTGVTSETTTTTTTTTTTGSSSTGAEVPELIAWYRFEEDPSQIEGALDSSDNGFDAQCAQTCPGATPGVQGQAIFNDDRGFLTVAAGDILALDALTLSVWIRDDSAADDSTTNMIAAKPYLSDGENSYKLHTRDWDDNGVRDVVFRIDGDSTRDQVIFVPFGDRLGQWVHVAATWDGDTMALFIDGTEAGRIPAPIIAYDDQPLVIGADLNAFESDNFWEGAIDELEVFSRVLTPAEIQQRAQ